MNTGANGFRENEYKLARAFLLNDGFSHKPETRRLNHRVRRLIAASVVKNFHLLGGAMSVKAVGALGSTNRLPAVKRS